MVFQCLQIGTRVLSATELRVQLSHPDLSQPANAFGSGQSFPGSIPWVHPRAICSNCFVLYILQPLLTLLLLHYESTWPFTSDWVNYSLHYLKVPLFSFPHDLQCVSTCAPWVDMEHLIPILSLVVLHIQWLDVEEKLPTRNPETMFLSTSTVEIRGVLHFSHQPILIHMQRGTLSKIWTNIESSWPPKRPIYNLMCRAPRTLKTTTSKSPAVCKEHPYRRKFRSQTSDNMDR